ncbi:MAG: AAA family ATPase, partial [Leptospiraceae bacterium]|nr:AAA family ATPase [Leptospiraceae bacterium]
MIDFGISSIISKEKEIFKNPNVLEGTISYISPEQSGRMNRIIDYRTDFYSLGVTLFELFTNNLPFVSDDPMELIHKHIAEPIPQIQSEIPISIIKIIEKLMEKNAEDRYQSAYGLKYDLEKSLNHQKEKDRIQTFKLAEKDISSELNIPQKLYGREKELSGILEIFQRASEDKLEVVLVSGYSGTGKSAIVQEIYKPITKRNGYFISGKFDQLQKDIPYSALVHAFTELVRQILTEPDENIESWKNKFLEVLSINAGVIIDVIPELGIILGDQPPVAELEPKESQNRFNLYFERFIHVLLKPEHPLVIFLDDLQWADSASLRFMQNLLTGDGVKHLLFIGAYRDNEVYAGHPFLEMIKDLEKINLPISNFLLKPLSGSDIINLLSDTFQTPNDKNRELSELLIKKTEGNPFFLRELLKSLYGDEKIQFSHSSGKWNWDIEEIQNAEITDNVVELMTSRLKKLPELTQEALKFASCIGSEFDSKTLSLISKKSIFDLATALMQAIEEGLILSHNNDHKFLLLQDKSLENIQINYKFVHDRIQQAAYLLIPEEQKLEFHREIGETYLKTLTEQEIEERIFDVVGHFNISMELIIEQEKSIKLVELNLLAGKRAKNSSAYEPSFNYLKIGIDLLGEKGWETHYQLMFNLHLEITEAAYLSTQFEEMSKYVEISKINVKTKIEKVKIIELELAFYMAKGNNQEIINLSKIALENLNFKFSLKPNIFQILYNYTYLKLILWNKNREFLLNLKENANI